VTVLLGLSLPRFAHRQTCSTIIPACSTSTTPRPTPYMENMEIPDSARQTNSCEPVSNFDLPRALFRALRPWRRRRCNGRPRYRPAKICATGACAAFTTLLQSLTLRAAAYLWRRSALYGRSLCHRRFLYRRPFGAKTDSHSTNRFQRFG